MRAEPWCLPSWHVFALESCSFNQASRRFSNICGSISFFLRTSCCFSCSLIDWFELDWVQRPFPARPTNCWVGSFSAILLHNSKHRCEICPNWMTVPNDVICKENLMGTISVQTWYRLLEISSMLDTNAVTVEKRTDGFTVKTQCHGVILSTLRDLTVSSYMTIRHRYIYTIPKPRITNPSLSRKKGCHFLWFNPYPGDKNNPDISLNQTMLVMQPSSQVISESLHNRHSLDLGVADRFAGANGSQPHHQARNSRGTSRRISSELEIVT